MRKVYIDFFLVIFSIHPAYIRNILSFFFLKQFEHLASFLNDQHWMTLSIIIQHKGFSIFWILHSSCLFLEHKLNSSSRLATVLQVYQLIIFTDFFVFLPNFTGYYISFLFSEREFEWVRSREMKERLSRGYSFYKERGLKRAVLQSLHIFISIYIYIYINLDLRFYYLQYFNL